MKLKYREKQLLGLDIANLFVHDRIGGEVGIELEFEGNKFPKEVVSKGWTVHTDHSLRGHDNVEYVLTRPINFTEVNGHVLAIFSDMAKYGTILDDSNRTSVHVHLNCHNFHMNRIATFAGIYFTLEEVLAEYCGEHRVGNLFCLRAIDAPDIISTLARFIKNNGSMDIREGMHYAGFNIHALRKFGSIEIRLMRGAMSASQVTDWVSILQRIYELSADFPSPYRVAEMFSESGPLAFFDSILGPMSTTVRNSIGWSDDQVREALYRGIRLAQDILYAQDWNVYKPHNPKPDPFRRPAKRVMKSRANQPAQTLQMNTLPPLINHAEPVQTTQDASVWTTTWAPAPTPTELWPGEINNDPFNPQQEP